MLRTLTILTLSVNNGDLIVSQMALVAFNCRNAQVLALTKPVSNIKIPWDVIWQGHAYLSLNNVMVLPQQQNVIIIRLLAKHYQDADGIKKIIYVLLYHVLIYH